MPKRRDHGDGGLWQRCDLDRGCPARIPQLDDSGEPVLNDDGRPVLVRPEHKCRGMWVGSLDLGYEGGRRRQPRVYATTKAKAAKKLAALREQVEKSGGVVPVRGMTVEKWVEYWLANVVPKKPKTLSYYRNNAASYILPPLGSKRIDRLTTADVRELHRYVLSRTRTRIVDGERVQVPLSVTTAHHAHTTLVTMLNDALRESPPIVTVNVAELVDPPGRAPSTREALTSVEARALLLATVEDRLSSRWMTALLTGARQGECLGLRWPCVDWDRDLIDLAWQLQRIPFAHGCGDETPEGWPCGRQRGGSCPDRVLEVPATYAHVQLDGGLCIVRPKSEAGIRIVPMIAPLRAALERRRQAYETERRGYRVDHGLVWPRPDGRPEDDRTDRAAWYAAGEAAGIDRGVLHVARHTTATLLMEAGVDVKVVQEIVGHTTAAQTHAYQHVDTTVMRESLDRLGGLLQLGG